MGWFKVDDQFHASHKLLSIPKRYRFQAAGLWTIAGSWVASQETDGFVPNYMLDVWQATSKCIDALVAADLWVKSQGGYTFSSWLNYNPSKADTDAKREASKLRMRALRERTRTNDADKDAGQKDEHQNVTLQRSNDVTQDVAPQRSMSVTQGVLLSRPDPNRSADADPKNSQKGATGFDDFWAVVPRKVGKRAARRAWEKAVKVESPQVIVQKMREYRDDPNRVDEYTKHPSTWLNAGCWEDDPLPPRNQGKKQPNDLDAFLDAFDTRSNHGPAGSLSAEQSLNGVSVPRQNFEALETRTDVVDAEGWEEVEDQKNPIDIEDNDIPF